ncbi:MAG: polyketide antibiotic transporter [Solirubrobacteraceae bacterium]
MTAARALAGRLVAAARTRTAAFAYLFVAVSYATVTGYASAYPTVADRLALAHTFGGNVAARLFFGQPLDLLTVGGFAAWRGVGLLAVFAAMWGLLVAVRILRGEEESGGMELVLSGVVSRRAAFLAAVAVIWLGAAVLWAATCAGLVVGGLALGGSLYLALAVVAAAPVFAGVGALASQLVPTARQATLLGSAALLLALVLRVVADTVAHLAWLRWATPLGWIEELRPFAGPRPAVLILPVLAAAVLLGAAGSLAERRDIGAGLIPVRDSAPPRRRLLATPTAQALRLQIGSLTAWLVGCAFFAAIIGVVSTTIAAAGLSPGVQKQLHTVIAVSILSPSGYIALTFLMFVLALSFFACAQIAAARRKEIEQRLQTLLAQPVSRHGWLAGRLVLAAGAATVLALAAGASAWVGEASQSAGIPLSRMLEAGANCLPTVLLFLGLGALAYAVAPRAAAGLSYCLVAVAFVWDLLGPLLGAPAWLLGLTPFQHVGLVAAQPFRVTASLVMLAVAGSAAAAAIVIFGRRDLVA